MGKYSDFERRPRDFYETPEKAFLPLVPHITKGSYIIEPNAGAGKLVDHIEKHLYPDVLTAWDIEPQRADIEQSDIFEALEDIKKYEKLIPDYFIGNPPWENSSKSDFQLNRMIMACSDLATTWFLMDGNYMFNKKSYPCMKRCVAIVPVGRVKWIEDSASTGKENCAWYCFDVNTTTSYSKFYPRG